MTGGTPLRARWLAAVKTTFRWRPGWTARLLMKVMLMWAVTIGVAALAYYLSGGSGAAVAVPVILGPVLFGLSLGYAESGLGQRRKNQRHAAKLAKSWSREQEGGHEG